ncbi:MAG: radical SAM protein [Phycisphaerae bacterium]|nr:radical SAM protein [Phycisphaerae bacterium]MDD5380893.1 radical SAM protein [Phycisphaerae bacterium]
MAEEKKYLYGPVPSRRLGRSLGVDIVPFKLCSLDCVYCQLGKTTEKTLHRSDFLPVEAVLAELKDKLAAGLEADFITIGGSGEPTLHSRLGELIDGIKKITAIPVAILTNGTMLYKPDVRADCAKADVVLPSLDAGDEQTYQRINRPHSGLSIERLISGLCALRDEFQGQIWLEVFLIEGFNTDNQQIAKIKSAIDRIHPDKVQLNTAVRPTTEPGVKALDHKTLRAIARQLGQNCEVIADFSPAHAGANFQAKAEDVLSMLKRRPCSLSDISSALGITPNEVLKYITHLQQQGAIASRQKNGVTFFFKAN